MPHQCDELVVVDLLVSVEIGGLKSVYDELLCPLSDDPVLSDHLYEENVHIHDAGFVQVFRVDLLQRL